MTVYLVPNTGKEAALHMTQQAADVLAAEGVRLLADPALSQRLMAPGGLLAFLPPQESYAACDVVVTIGGDGTMLHTARQSMQYQKPLLGINSGHLGFLTVLEKDEAAKLRRLPAGDWRVEARSMLRYHWDGMQAEGGAEENETLALNDVVLFKEAPEKAINLDIRCDGKPVSSFRGDGVIFATPTGSTAYSMSAGGPVLDARLGGIVVTQICAHIVQMPPMVFAGDRVLQVTSHGGAAEQALIICDGRRGRRLPAGVPVRITQAEQTVPLVQFDDSGQLSAIDKKLKGR